MNRCKANWPSFHALEEETLALAHVLKTASAGGGGWPRVDYGPILVHQLGAPLGAELVRWLAEADAAGETSARTFGELLFQPAPAPRALLSVKNYAKQLMDENRFAYPRPVATVLYFASIAAACLQADVLISSLPPAEIQRGLDWARRRDWIPARLERLFAEALRRLDAGPWPPAWDP